MPALVVRNEAGEVEAVSYHEMPAMPLNELQKQQKRLRAQEDQIAALLARLAAVESQVCSPQEAR